MKSRSPNSSANGPSKPSSAKPASRVVRRTATAPQEVRVIGGMWKRSLLPVSQAPGLRPTPSRVRETLFNWLGQDMSGWRCVDAFAGSGALGIEAASRGAQQVVLVEQDAALVRALRQTVDRLKAQDRVTVRQGDALASLRALPPKGLDLVFLDPPFGGEEGNDALVVPVLQAAQRAVLTDGWVYLEAPRPWTDEELAALGLSCFRRGKAGQVAFHLLQVMDLPDVAQGPAA